jgi:hypothetical protein
VKNVWLRMAQIGRRNSATMNLTHLVGTISGAETNFSRALRDDVGRDQ